MDIIQRFPAKWVPAKRRKWGIRVTHAGNDGLERDLLSPLGAWTHGASPLGRAVVGALPARLLSVTWAYVEKVGTQFLSLRHCYSPTDFAATNKLRICQ